MSLPEAIAPARRAQPTPRRRPAPPPRAPHLRVVPDGRRRRVRAAVVLGVVVTVGSLFLLAAGNVLVAQRHLELERLRAEQGVEQAAYEQNRLEVAELAAPAAVVAAAHDLGMVEPVSVEQLAVPEAAPDGRGAGPDETATTLRETHDEGKPHLAPAR